MKEIVTEAHTESCIERSKRQSVLFSNYCCGDNPERFLFFAGNKFFLITYNKCLSGYENTYDFKMDIVKSVIEKHKILPAYETYRGVDVEYELRHFRLRNRQIRKKVTQFNYIYESASGKEYAIATETDFVSTIFNQDLIRKNYEDSLLFLEKNGYTWLVDDIKRLYSANRFLPCDDIEYCKTIDHLLILIKKEIENGNNKKGKQQGIAKAHI